MRVLHTSDWHLGLSTGPVSRAPEHAAFLRWLVDTVRARRFDAVVVAGDVFDTVAPSAESQRLYYRWLAALTETGVGTVVIVGGNHDSQARLDAPRELLDAFDVHVVGGLPPRADSARGHDRLDEMIVPLRRRRVAPDDPQGPIGAVCLAVPYVHEWRLGIRTTDGDTAALAEAFRERFTQLYAELTDRASEAYPGLPIIATGHLTVGQQHDPQDYPQEIHQVGSIDALPPSVFDRRLRYVALGHVHRCYPVADGRAWYCGSPVATSVTERKVPRRVLQIDLEDVDAAHASRQMALPLDTSPAVTRIEVPTWRRIACVEGPLSQVEHDLDRLAREAELDEGERLAPLAFVRVHTDSLIPDLRDRLQALFETRPEARRPILVEIREVRASPVEPEGPPAPTALEDLAPIEVFRRLCDAAGVTERAGLERAFDALVSLPEDDFEAVLTAAAAGEPTDCLAEIGELS